jgi:hypothetical protein
LAAPADTSRYNAEHIVQAKVMIDGIEFRIFVPKATSDSEGARAPFEVVILERCAFEGCQRVIGLGGSLKRHCSEKCKNDHHNLLRKFSDAYASKTSNG